MLIRLGRRSVGLVLVVLLVVIALLASMATEEREPPRPYEPPPCRLVPSPAGAWGDARCLHAPARHVARWVDAADR
jgi:hypothetical protein